MSHVLVMNWEDFCEAADDSETIKSTPWRWGTNDTMLFKVGDDHYTATIQVHTQEGWQAQDQVRCTRVHQVEKIVKVWEPVE